MDSMTPLFVFVIVHGKVAQHIDFASIGYDVLTQDNAILAGKQLSFERAQAIEKWVKRTAERNTCLYGAVRDFTTFEAAFYAARQKGFSRNSIKVVALAGTVETEGNGEFSQAIERMIAHIRSFNVDFHQFPTGAFSNDELRDRVLSALSAEPTASQ